jgi:hypothetical protein
MAKKQKYMVGIFYQTPTGRAGAKNYILLAENEGKALKLAEKRFMRDKKGKGYKVHGGDVQVKH